MHGPALFNQCKVLLTLKMQDVHFLKGKLWCYESRKCTRKST